MAKIFEQHRNANGSLAGRGLLDLTMPMSERTIPLPGHPSTELEPLHPGDGNGLRSMVMRYSVHTGTHVDAPSHSSPDGAPIDEIPIERFWRAGIRLDLDDVAPGQPIRLEQLETAGFSPGRVSGSILLLSTGWTDRAWKSERLYEEHPFLADDASRAVAAARPTALGLDCPVDQGNPWPNHSILLGAEVLLIENLMGLDALPPDGFEVIAFPMRLTGGTGAPARVIASIPR
jgi:kynurenine formamidase